jgi:penicillin-binding protein-related factor A (putative recombinase)
MNTGKPSEAAFDNAWKRVGKTAHVFKFTDAAESRGMNRKAVGIKPQPSDRLLTYQGKTIYAEIKSTIDERNFPFSLLRPTQGAFAAAILAAGGDYDLFIHSLATNRWFRVPYAVVQKVRAAGKSSISWDNLSQFAWNFPNVP